jgi:hypothetical protein
MAIDQGPVDEMSSNKMFVDQRSIDQIFYDVLDL